MTATSRVMMTGKRFFISYLTRFVYRNRLIRTRRPETNVKKVHPALMNPRSEVGKRPMFGKTVGILAVSTPNHRASVAKY